MDKRTALLAMAKGSRAIISVEFAKQIADACGVSFNMLLFVEPELVTTAGKNWLVLKKYAGRDSVQVSELAASIARYMGLYADRDHAHQSPHGTKGKEAQYIGQRACIRLAREMFGESGVRDLIQECEADPHTRINRDVQHERVFKV